MKKTRISAMLNLYAMPVLLVVLGVIFLINPDSASIFLAKVLGWSFLTAGVIYGICAAVTWPVKRFSRLLVTGIFLAAGSFLLISPLSLAKNMGRFLGLMLAVEGGKNLGRAGGSKSLAAITLLVAVVLMLAPMTASRLVFRLVGLLLLCIGGALLIDRLRRRRLSQNPDIIDAL